MIAIDLWVQNGLPEKDDLVFNVHFRRPIVTDWDVSYTLSQYAQLDVDINLQTDAIKDISFPRLNQDLIREILTPGYKKFKLIELENCRYSLEQWVYYVVSRITLMPWHIRDLVEKFFHLPQGPSSLNQHENLSQNVTRKYSGSQRHSRDSNRNLINLINPELVFDPTKKHEGIIQKTKKNFLNFFSNKPARKDIPVINSLPRRASESAVKHRAISQRLGVLTSNASASSISTASNHVQKEFLLKVVIKRGDYNGGNFEADVVIKYSAFEHTYNVRKHYSDFCELRQELESEGRLGIASPFPERSFFSFSISSEESLQAETRQLDQWMKELLDSYINLSESQQRLVSKFLILSRRTENTAIILEKLNRGLVEAPRAFSTHPNETTGAPISVCNGDDNDSSEQGKKLHPELASWSRDPSSIQSITSEPVGYVINLIKSRGQVTTNASAHMNSEIQILKNNTYSNPFYNHDNDDNMSVISSATAVRRYSIAF